METFSVVRISQGGDSECVAVWESGLGNHDSS